MVCGSTGSASVIVISWMMVRALSLSVVGVVAFFLSCTLALLHTTFASKHIPMFTILSKGKMHHKTGTLEIRAPCHLTENIAGNNAVMSYNNDCDWLKK